jgi:hypothetical protein
MNTNIHTQAPASESLNVEVLMAEAFARGKAEGRLERKLMDLQTPERVRVVNCIPILVSLCCRVG